MLSTDAISGTNGVIVIIGGGGLLPGALARADAVLAGVCATAFPAHDF